MTKYELKTKVNDGDVMDFLNSIENDKRREDSLKILDIMTELTGEEAKMWGKSIVGFGTYTYQYASGQKGDWMCVGFSPENRISRSTSCLVSSNTKNLWANSGSTKRARAVFISKNWRMLIWKCFGKSSFIPFN